MGKLKIPNVPKVLKSVKYTLSAVNAVFLLTGLLLLTAGIAVLVIYSGYDQLITQRFFNVAGLTTATGVIILLISVLGVYAALSEHFYFVAGYVVLMVVVLVLEIAIVASAFALSDGASRDIRSTMLQSLIQYNNRPEVAKIWDEMQIGFECCGVVGRDDYANHLIPVSCCHIPIGTIAPFECQTSNVHQVGCAAALGDWLAYNADALAICALVALCIQVIMTPLSGWMAWRSKFEEVELES